MRPRRSRAGEQPVHQHAEHPLKSRAGARVAQQQRLLQAFLGGTRPQRRVLATGEPLREHTRRSEAVGELRAPQPAQLAERANAEAPERLDQRFGLHAEAEQPHRPAGEPAAGVLAIQHERPARARRQGARQRTEACRPGPHARGTIKRTLGGGDRGGVRSVQPAQPAGLEVGESRALLLDGRADRFQGAYDGLPGLGNPHGVGGREQQIGAAGERLSEDHPAGHTAGLGGP